MARKIKLTKKQIKNLLTLQQQATRLLSGISSELDFNHAEGDLEAIEESKHLADTLSDTIADMKKAVENKDFKLFGEN